jgi:hypothetical protein
MYKKSYTMVNARQIVEKGLQGCKTTRTVTSFAQKHNVPWVWYRPTRTQKVLLVDWPQFRQTWREVKTQKTPTQPKAGRKSYTTTTSSQNRTRTYGQTPRSQAATRGTYRTAAKRTRRAA